MDEILQLLSQLGAGGAPSPGLPAGPVTAGVQAPVPQGPGGSEEEALMAAIMRALGGEGGMQPPAPEPAGNPLIEQLLQSGLLQQLLGQGAPQ